MSNHEVYAIDRHPAPWSKQLRPSSNVPGEFNVCIIDADGFDVLAPLRRDNGGPLEHREDVADAIIASYNAFNADWREVDGEHRRLCVDSEGRYRLMVMRNDRGMWLAKCATMEIRSFLTARGSIVDARSWAEYQWERYNETQQLKSDIESVERVHAHAQEV
mgnify:CR=1 FL=1